MTHNPAIARLIKCAKEIQSTANYTVMNGKHGWVMDRDLMLPLAEALAALDASPNETDGRDAWVNCAERMPDANHLVLVYGPTPAIMSAAYLPKDYGFTGSREKWWTERADFTTAYFTHWHPLPAPPLAKGAS